MKRFAVLLVVALCFAAPCFAQPTAPGKVPSVAQKIEPLFLGLGFAFKGKELFATELHVMQVQQMNLQNSKAQGLIKCIFLMGDTKLPVKIINPDLEKFEADVVKIEAGGADQPPVIIPIGHISMKVSQLDKIHSAGIGKVQLNIEGNEEKSGDFALYLNELPKPKAPAGGTGTAAAGADSGQ